MNHVKHVLVWVGAGDGVGDWGLRVEGVGGWGGGGVGGAGRLGG